MKMDSMNNLVGLACILAGYPDLARVISSKSSHALNPDLAMQMGSEKSRGLNPDLAMQMDSKKDPVGLAVHPWGVS
jgi:hypothetical protein